MPVSRGPVAGAAGALPLGAAGDRSELQAEHMAARVVDPMGPGWPAGLSAGGAAARGFDPPGVAEMFGGAGRPLDVADRAFFEARLRADFGSVRIHDDRTAAGTAAALSARAYSVGRHVAFGANQYEPRSARGMQLLAHELVHVMQQSRETTPVVRRAPALDGTSTDHLVDERIGPKIDKALAQSAKVTAYVPASKLRKVAGKIDVEDPVVFASLFKKQGGSGEDVDQVPGFVDRRADQPIKLRTQGRNDKGAMVLGATVEVALHEAIHFNSSRLLQASFGHNYNEGVTQYFVEAVLNEQGLTHGRAYPEKLKLAQGLIAALGPDGEDQVGKAYFNGDSALWLRLVAAHDTPEFAAWREAAAKDPPDVAEANRLLRELLRRTASPPAAIVPAGARGRGADVSPPAGGSSPAAPGDR
jgi:hypothetical protein